jgi:hypothetical protein
VVESNICACNREEVEKLINKLKAGGLHPPFDEKISLINRRSIAGKLPLLRGNIEISGNAARVREHVLDRSKVGNADRLADLLPFLISNGQLSPFVGKPVEWDALNSVVRELIRPVGVNGAAYGSDPILSADPLVRELVGNHFSHVVEEALRKTSFFNQEWQIDARGNNCVLRRVEDFPAGIDLRALTHSVCGLIMECDLCSCSDFQLEAGQTCFTGYILGKVHRKALVSKQDGNYLRMEFKPLAVMVS